MVKKIDGLKLLISINRNLFNGLDENKDSYSSIYSRELIDISNDVEEASNYMDESEIYIILKYLIYGCFDKCFIFNEGQYKETIYEALLMGM